VIPGVVLEFLALLGGVATGFLSSILLGPITTILLPFFLSSTRELNPFWLGYLIGCTLTWWLSYAQYRKAEDDAKRALAEFFVKMMGDKEKKKPDYTA